MKIRCDKCQTKYSIADEKVRGKVFKIKCKRCTNIIVVRGTDSETPQPAASFDQNETRVFDYGAGGSPEAAAGAGAPGSAAWYLVIDREQVGPLSPADISDKWMRAEIDAETYAWREGEADWLRIGDIEEFKFLTAGGAAGAASGEMGGEENNPFAAPPSEAGGASDPADLFAASSPASAGAADLFGGGGGGGADLFGGGPAAAPAQGADLFATAPASGMNGNGAGGGSPRVAVNPGMTGQRNENSVLFSLSNLAQLAADAPKATTPSPAFTSGGGTEGSGLIDIRAMAAMTMGGGGFGAASAGAARAAPDDLPMFSPVGFGGAPAGGMLLPSAPVESRSNMPLVVMVGLLAVVVLGMGAYLALGNKNAPAMPMAGPGTPGVETPGASDPPAGPDKVPGAAKGGTPDDDNGGDDGDEPTPGTPDRTKPDRTKPDRTKPDRTKPDRTKPDRTKPDRTKPDRTKPDRVRPSSSDGKCDEIECLVDPSKACCRKSKSSGSSGDRGGGGGGGSNLPESLEKSDVIAGVRKVSGSVGSCGDRFSASGVIKVKIKVGDDGRVKSAAAQGSFSGTPTGSCVEKAIKRAKFPKTKRGLGFTYPFRLS